MYKEKWVWGLEGTWPENEKCNQLGYLAITCWAGNGFLAFANVSRHLSFGLVNWFSPFSTALNKTAFLVKMYTNFVYQYCSRLKSYFKGHKYFSTFKKVRIAWLRQWTGILVCWYNSESVMAKLFFQSVNIDQIIVDTEWYN